MENKNVNPESSGEWNSDAIVLGNISCVKAAAFMDVFMSSFRTLAGAGKESGVEAAKAAIEMLRAIVDVSQRGNKSDEAYRIAVSGIGTALALSTQFGDPYDLANLAENANNTVYALVEENPKALSGNAVKFGVKKGSVPGSMEVGASLIPDGNKLERNLNSQNPDAN